MSNQLTTYTQTQNTAAPNSVINDLNSPFTFKEWLERNVGILPGKENIQYENYIKQWYKNQSTSTTTASSMREDYIQLLQQLTLAFKTEADAAWVSNIDFNNSDDVVQAIPFYATKLKEIAIYLINKREAIRRAKLKYNMVGTYTAVERLFYEYLLKAFTKRQYPGSDYITTVTDLSVLNAIPDLSAVAANFQITIDELYDNTTYFDRDPTLPASAYFSFGADVTAYLDSLSISPSGYEWIYNTGVTTLCADNPLLWSVDNVLSQYKNGIPISAVELYGSDILNDYNRIGLSQKYLGANKYIISGGYWIPWSNTVNFNLAQGNNWFYWLTGEDVFRNNTSMVLDPIYLSATNLIESGATAGTNILSADVVYVSRDNSLSGAWLRLTDTNTFSAIMSARLDNGKTVFAFPFPGYGVSGVDLEWTGAALDNLNPAFYYLDATEQQAVYDVYWNSTVSSTSAFNPLYIYDALLIEAGANAAEKFDEADYIVSRPAPGSNLADYVYTGTQEYAWLYRMNKTDIPIQNGDNNINWPFERYITDITMIATPEQCAPMPLSGISLQNFVGAVAGLTPDNADKIFKRPSPTSDSYIEGAWLAGNTLPQPRALTDAALTSGCYQPNLAMLVYGADYGSFIWSETTTLADNIFTNFKHQNDCWYLKDTQFSLYKERPSQGKNLNYNQWQDCTCRSVIYSPLGHPGSSFDAYGGMADFIVAISTAVSSFSFKDWKGIDGGDYTTSNEFGWFSLNQQYQVEPDVGWGSGNWVTNTGSQFMLSAGVMYLYYRSDMHRDDPSNNVPYLVVKHKNTCDQNQWNKLYFDKNTNQWEDAGVTTDMIISPGDMLYYSHQNTHGFVLTSYHYEYSTIIVPVLPDFNNFSMQSSIGDTNMPVSSTYIPIQALSQTGPAIAASLSTVGTISSQYYGMPSGPVTINASFNNPLSTTVISIVSAVSTMKIDYYTYTNASINFMLNVPLSGWDYVQSTYNGVSAGARPFWAIASDADDDYTKNKGINIWAGSPVTVDDYNFITQPTHSDMIFNVNTYIEYNKRTPGSVIWVQPVDVTTQIENKSWRKILIDTNGVSNLSAVLFNNTNEILVSATNLPSDLILNIIPDRPLSVNYYARNTFTWAQDIFNSSLGLPPTGGVWIPTVSGTLIAPSEPYANLTNRHFPTIASMPYVGNLYGVKDVGGYSIPQMLGMSTFLCRNRTYAIVPPSLSAAGTSRVYNSPSIYQSDYGFTQNYQVMPLSTVAVDSSWMKAGISEGQRAGVITNARAFQKFMPYQTTYEVRGTNNYGMHCQGDKLDPWDGGKDNTWKDNTNWPSNWRGQYNIAGWYNQFAPSGTQIYQWKTDIFGNQYMLLKDIQSKQIYDKKYTPGTLWTRDLNNNVTPGIISLSAIYNNIISFNPSISTSLITNILDIDIWNDTLMIRIPEYILITKLSFDYNQNLIHSTADNLQTISLANCNYGDMWFFEDENRVTLCILNSANVGSNYFYPSLYDLDIETTNLVEVYNGRNNTSLRTSTAISLTAVEDPTFTYNSDTHIYNIAFIGYSNLNAGMYFTTINIEYSNNIYDLSDYRILTPVKR